MKNMMNRQGISFDQIYSKVNEITRTGNTVEINRYNYLDDDLEKFRYPETYSEYGLSSLGQAVGFPAEFVREIEIGNPELAKNIITDRMNNYFIQSKMRGRGKSMFVREFSGRARGVVSNKYDYFDDNEVVDILADSPLKDLSFKESLISPERLHLRGIEAIPFRVERDTSDMFHAFFIDNSMVGASAFRISYGVYRLACTNGLIVPMAEFEVYKQIHKKSEMDKGYIAAEFREALERIALKKEWVQNELSSFNSVESALEKIKNKDTQMAYLSRKLNVSGAESEKILTLYDAYSEEFNYRSRWALMNAVTEFARDINDINKRTFLERRIYKVA